MTRPTWSDVRFLLALPVAVLADLLGFVDTKYADALNDESDNS